MFEDFFKKFCYQIDKSDVSYLVLRNYEQLPIGFGNDIDILLDEDCFKKTEKILHEITDALGLKLVHESQRFNFNSYKIINLHSDQVLVKLDFFTGLSKGWISYMNIDDMLSVKVKKDCFYIPKLEHEVYALMMKEMLMYGHVRPKYHEYFKVKFESIDKVVFIDLLSQYLLKDSVTYIADHISNLYDIKYYPKPKLKFVFKFHDMFSWIFMNIKDKLGK